MPWPRRALVAPALAFTLLTPSALSAQEPERPPIRLDERIVVTAGRGEEPLAEVGSSISVITREEIEASGAFWLRDVLARAPGVTVVSNGGPGTVTSVFLRGANSNQTLVLLDGVKVNTPTTGAFDVGSLPTSAIERVEVLRGAQSVLYGSEAIGGVVHVITRRGEAPGATEIALAHGSFDTTRATLTAGGRSGDLSGSLTGDLYASDGFSVADADAGNPEPDSFDNRSVTARGAWQSGRSRVEAFVSLLHGDAEIDGFTFGVGPTDDPEQTQSTTTVDTGARIGWGAGIWDGELLVSRSHQEYELRDPDGFYTESGYAADLLELDLQNTLRPGEDSTVLVGTEIRREAADTFSRFAGGEDGFDQSTTTTGAYARYALRVADGWHASAGARIEDHSRFGTETTWRATLSGRLAPWARLHGSAGTGFRAPSLNELYFPLYGDTGLAPESSTGWDLGVELGPDDRRVSVDATVWRTRVEQLIQFGLAGFENLGRARTAGLEVESRWRIAPGWHLAAGYTLTDTEDLATGLALLRRPRHSGSVRLGWSAVGGARAALAAQLTGERDDFGSTGRAALPGYARVDLAGAWPLAGGLEINARVENLLDADYQEVLGYGTAGRSVWLGLRYAWDTR